MHRIDPADLIAVSERETRHRPSFWDALIIISAARSSRTILATEDLQHGRSFEKLLIPDPFQDG